MFTIDWVPLLLSLQVASIGIVWAGIVGIAIASLLATPGLVGRNIIDVLVTAPMVLPPTVLGYYVLVALGRNSVIGAYWESVTGSSIVFTKTGAVVAAALGALPIVVKSSRAALEDVDPVLLRAARTLGAGRIRTWFYVQLPLAARGIIAGLMLGFARALGDFGVTLMVAGDIPGETQTASLAIYDAIQANRGGDALGLILVLSAFAIFILYFVNRFTERAAA